MTPAIPRPVGRDVLLLAAAAFASAAGMRLCDPMLPELARHFGVGLPAASAVVTGFAVAYGLLQFVYGPLGDRFDKRRLVGWAAAASALTTLLCAAAPGLATLVAARVLAGATAAAIIPLSMAWIGDAVAYEDRQPVLARFISGQILGLVAGQAAGGVLIDAFGWRAAFVALALAFGAAALLILRGGAPASASPPAASRAGVADALRRSLGIAGQPWPKVILATVFAEGVALYGGFAFIAAHLHDALGLSLAAAGTLLAGFGLGGLLYTLNARRLVSRLGEAGLASGGGTVLAAAFGLLAWTDDAWLAEGGIVLAGLGFYMLHNTLQTNATQMAPAARGAAVALFASLFFLGQSVGVAAAAPFIDAHGARPVFAGCAVGLLVVGLAFGRRLRRRTHAPRATA